MKRRLECVAGSSNKFYELAIVGNQLTITFGRNGTAGQTQQKYFATPAAALIHVAGLIQKKLAKGYRELPGVPAC